MQAQSIPLARYRFSAVVQERLPLPDYSGSLLRGQFGASLRKVACMTLQATCPGCPLLQTCQYSRIFETPPPISGRDTLQVFSQVPKPFVLEPPAPGKHVLQQGEVLAFNLVLMGHAIEQLPLLVFALQRALARGLTRERAPAVLTQVDWLDAQGSAHPIWTQAQQRLLDHDANLHIPTLPPDATSITLHLHTPLRLQQQSGPLGVSQLTPHALIAALVRRTALVLELHANQTGWGESAKALAALSDTITETRDLQWFDWARYSSRQRQEIPLGGVLGRWSLQAPTTTLHALWPWLWLGQWLHVGKAATLGLGCYTLDVA